MTSFSGGGVFTPSMVRRSVLLRVSPTGSTVVFSVDSVTGGFSCSISFGSSCFGCSLVVAPSSSSVSSFGCSGLSSSGVSSICCFSSVSSVSSTSSEVSQI